MGLLYSGRGHCVNAKLPTGFIGNIHTYPLIHMHAYVQILGLGTSVWGNWRRKEILGITLLQTIYSGGCLMVWKILSNGTRVGGL